MVWLYDIFLKENGILVGTQGDYEFDTKEEAYEDAVDYIQNGLMEEYNKEENDFRIETYEGWGSEE